MKKIVNLTFTRYLAVLSAVIAGSLCIFSLAGIFIASAVNVYDSSLNTAVGNGQNNLLGLYSRYIFEAMRDGRGSEIMEDSNMEYVIVKGINPNEDIDSKKNILAASDVKNIVYSNNSSYLSGLKESDIAGFKSVKIFSEDEAFYYRPATLLESFFNNGYQHNNFSNYKSYTEYVSKIFYDDGVFYFETENYAFPVKTLEVPASVLPSKDYKMLRQNEYVFSKKEIVEFKLETSNQGKRFYRSTGMYNVVLDTGKYQKWKKISFNGIAFLPETIEKGKISEGKTFFDYNKDYKCYTDEVFEVDALATDELETNIYNSIEYLNLNISYKIKDDSYSNIYVIFSNVRPTVVNYRNDLFAIQKSIITFLYKMRYIMIAVSVISVVVFLIMLILACHSKYLSSDDDKVRKNIIHRLPFLVYLFIVGGILIIDVAFGIAVFAREVIIIEDAGFIVFKFMIAVLWVMSCIFFLILLLLEISCRAGAQILFKNTLLYLVYRIVKKILGTVKEIFNKINDNIPLFTKTVAVLIAINVFMLLQLLLVTEIYVDDVVQLLFMLINTAICIIFDFIVLKMVFQMENLQKHAKKMADGSLESKANTSTMMQPFKKHGEYLNKISEGMSVAVNERIKSEHFKTELITNVSHDIKTPLTSIINYVDLLKKENIQEPKAQEYIEVLERQSARLKKLIEDLMEASKASTGNIELKLELCDINILLTQTLGEFEEKLSSKGLTFVINKPEESIYIMADNRHIWRIFDNLMNNICKYGQPDTRVYINLESKNNEAIIIFRNTSNYQLNISSDELLERFVRGDSSRHTEGSGLGLSIAQNLAELMGGSLKLYVDGDLFKVVLSFPKTDAPKVDIV